MIINHNLPALNTLGLLNANQSNAAKSIQKLSSGMRINGAADDAAGLAISEKMRAQIRGLDMANRNAQDGISMIQTAEGALNETHDILQRMRELAVQASNDTSTDQDRSSLQKEISQLKSEIDRVSNTTEFNTKKLLNGDLSAATTARGDILQSAVAQATIVNAVQGGTGNAVQISGGNNTLVVSEQHAAVNVSGAGIADTAYKLSGGTFTVTAQSGASVTVTIASGVYSGADLATTIQSQLSGGNAAFSGIGVNVDTSGKVHFDMSTAGSLSGIFSISAGGEATELGISGVTVATNASGAGLATTKDAFATGTDFNFTVSVNGGAATTIDVSGTFSGLADAVKAINAQLTADGIALSGSVSAATGSGIEFDATNSGTYAISGSTIGFSSAGTASGSTAVQSSITLTNGIYTASGLASEITTQLSGTFVGSGLSVTASGDELKLLVGSSASGVSYSINAVASGTADSGLGISANATVTPGNSGGFGANITYNSDVISSANDQFSVSINGGTATTVQIASGSYSGAADLANAVNAGLTSAGLSGLTAAVSGSDIVLKTANANGNNTYTIKNTGSDTALTTLGITSGQVITNQKLLTNFQDQNGDSLGINSGDTITINGQVGGASQSAVTLSVTSLTTLQDLENKISSGFGLVSGSVSITASGNIQITGNSGVANNISNVQLSIAGNTKFDNVFSNFSETQDAQDNKTNNALSFHIGANQDQTMRVDISEMSVHSLSLSSVDIGTQQGAENSMTVINNAINAVSNERAKLGAYQNRLEHSINNLGTSSQNLTAAESRIRDVDMAKEMMNFTKSNILTQAAQSMLAQANQQPQGVLQLLR